MKRYEKTLVGGLVSILIGTSCCWISSLAIALGGAAFAGTIAGFLDDAQLGLLVGGVVLLVLACYQYYQRAKVSRK